MDILNDKRVLIDGEDIQRQVIPIKRLQLTRQILKIGRGARTGKVRATISKDNVAKKFADSSLGKSFAKQQRRQNLTDFERYKVLVLRRKLSKLSRARPNKKWLALYLNKNIHSTTSITPSSHSTPTSHMTYPVYLEKYIAKKRVGIG